MPPPWRAGSGFTLIPAWGNAPPILFLKKENAPRPVEEKNIFY